MREFQGLKPVSSRWLHGAAEQFAEKGERVSSRAQQGLPAAGRDLLFGQMLRKKQIPPAKGDCGKAILAFFRKL
jgi:hypothetical protein